MIYRKLIFGASVLAMFTLIGCSSGKPPEAKPQFNPGEGAISGKILDAYNDPFDVSLAGDGGAKAIQVELFNATGASETTHPQDEKATFIFNHLKPGRYELSVYTVVRGKRTLAGNAQATVDPGQITAVSLPLTVTSLRGD